MEKQGPVTSEVLSLEQFKLRCQWRLTFSKNSGFAGGRTALGTDHLRVSLGSRSRLALWQMNNWGRDMKRLKHRPSISQVFKISKKSAMIAFQNFQKRLIRQ